MWEQENNFYGKIQYFSCIILLGNFESPCFYLVLEEKGSLGVGYEEDALPFQGEKRVRSLEFLALPTKKPRKEAPWMWYGYMGGIEEAMLLW